MLVAVDQFHALGWTFLIVAAVAALLIIVGLARDWLL